MPLHTTHAKASAQVRRSDHAKAAEYSAELRHRAFKPRAILGITTAYAVKDELHHWSTEAVQRLAKAFAVKPDDFALAPPDAYYDGARPLPALPGQGEIQQYQDIVTSAVNTIADAQGIPRHLLREAENTAQYVRERPTDAP
ncbi:hypothetical protein ACWD7Y_05260 [Streptomyces drozdowiczii]